MAGAPELRQPRWKALYPSLVFAAGHEVLGLGRHAVAPVLLRQVLPEDLTSTLASLWRAPWFSAGADRVGGPPTVCVQQELRRRCQTRPIIDR